MGLSQFFGFEGANDMVPNKPTEPDWWHKMEHYTGGPSIILEGRDKMDADNKTVEEPSMDTFDDLFEEKFGVRSPKQNEEVAAKTPTMNQVRADHGFEQLGEGADGGGKRYNKGKNLMELTPPEWESALGDVSTKGSYKYDQRNWEKGMKWSTMIGCMKRHINKFLAGERYDGDGFDIEKGTTGCHHLAMVAWNALALMSYDLREIGEDDLPDLPEELFNRVNAQTSDLDVLFHPEPPLPTTGVKFIWSDGEKHVDWESMYMAMYGKLAMEDGGQHLTSKNFPAVNEAPPARLDRRRCAWNNGREASLWYQPLDRP